MIAFTYDPATAVGRTRLFSGDTDPDGLNRTGGDRTRTDEEILALLSSCGGDPRLAAASVLEGKAAEFAATAFVLQQGGLRQDFRQRSMRLLDAAAALRSQAAAASALCAASVDPAFTSGPAGTMEGW